MLYLHRNTQQVEVLIFHLDESREGMANWGYMNRYNQ